MGGLDSTRSDTVEWLVWGNSLRRRIFVAATASILFGILHLHPLRSHKAG
tara:strand:- start:109 stop:258 length:150 start_codon:yes stop_codon:yes gene_type:complete